MKLTSTTIAQKSHILHKLIVEDLLDIAKLPGTYYESMLSIALERILDNKCNVRSMTCQERYGLLLKFLDATEDKNLGQDINIDDFMGPDVAGSLPLFAENIEKQIKVRQLTGIEAEALERGCENTADWILGAMAMQITCKELPELDISQLNLEVNYVGKIIHGRIETIKTLDLDRNNEVIKEYKKLNHQLQKIVYTSFDNGIVLNKFEGGTDDAPRRFRITSAFTGESYELFSIINGAHTAIQY